MQSKRVFLAGVASVAAMGLAGCGSSGSTSAIKDALYATTDADTAAKALDDGKTLAAYDNKMSSTIQHKDVRTLGAEKVTIKKNASGGIDVTVNGETESYSSENISADGYGFESDDRDRNIYTYSAHSAQDAVNGKSGYAYHQRWGYFWNPKSSDDSAVGMLGFAVLGTETAPEKVAARDATATYSGEAYIYSHGTDENSYDRTSIRGDLTLTADFGQGEVSGSVGNLEGRERVNDEIGEWVSAPGAELALQKADIVGNGYEGKIAANDTFKSTLDVTEFDGTYRGKFFGPDAEETAGVIAANGVADGEDFVATGSFSADED